MVYVLDPVGAGLVASFSHLGGNLTGLTQDVSAEISGKRLVLLKEWVFRPSRGAVLFSPSAADRREPVPQRELSDLGSHVELHGTAVDDERVVSCSGNRDEHVLQIAR